MSFQTKLRTFLKVRAKVVNWLSVIAGQLSKRRSELEKLDLRNGMTVFYRGRTEDWEIVKELVLENPYALAFSYLQQQQDDPVVLDLGANIGLFGLYAASLNRKSRVHCYEPDKYNVELLQRNREANPALRDRIHSHPEAVGGKSRTANFYMSEKVPQAGSLKGAYLEGVYKTEGKSQEVSVRAFGEIVLEFPRQIALVKMDVEGAEYEIVRDTPESTWSKVNAISMEIHADPDKKSTRAELAERMKSFGFSCIHENESKQNFFFYRPGTFKPDVSQSK